MDKCKARVRIVSRMTDPQGGIHEEKHARAGALTQENGGICLTYDDMQDGVRAHVVLSATTQAAQMQRTGEMTGALRFVPGQRVAGTYATAYGEIPVATFTHGVTLERTEAGGRLLLAYDVFVGGERTAFAEMDISWRL